MKGAIRQGWAMTRRHKYVLVVLFLYRLLWGFFLYRFIDTIVSNVLLRYPDDHPLGEGAANLFLIEAQFRLMKTNLASETLWMLGGMLLLRMILTPILNAGLYYSFTHADDGQGTQVIQGIRQSWKSVALLYWSEMLVSLLPLFWIFPIAKKSFLSGADHTAWLRDMLPYAAIWVVWVFLIHLLFLFMQFSSVSREHLMSGFFRALKRALPLCLASLLLIGIGAAASLAVTAASLFWTGFLAVALHQSFQFVRCLMTVWTMATQHQIWRPDQHV